MYIRHVGGSFFSHPFWRTRFKLTSQADVDCLRAGDVPYVEIDDALGYGPIEDEAPPSRSGTALIDQIGENLAAPKSSKSHRASTMAPVFGSAEHDRAVQCAARARSVVGRLFDAARLGKSIPVDEAITLVAEVDAMFERGENMLLDVIRMKTADQYTYLHSVAVCALMIKFARHLDLAPGEVRECGLAGLLHDVGKMRIPEHVLHKPGALTHEEFQIVKSHAQEGYATLCGIPDLPQAVLDVARLHHEKIDGTGYPLGLAGDQIPQVARMGAICDVYDALTSNRAYKAAWEPARAIARMLTWQGHFDHALLTAFAESLNFGPFDPSV